MSTSSREIAGQSQNRPRQPTSLKWVGGGNNSASNPNDWTPGFTPIAGDKLSISSGTINIYGNVLAGDTLSTTSSGGTVNIIAGPEAKLNLNEGANVTVNITVHNTLTFNVSATRSGKLNVSGGPIRFIGDNNLQGSQVFHDKLEGRATFHLFGAQGEGDSTEIDGAVGSGLTFALSGISQLTIDQPNTFQGLLDLTHRGIINDVVFAGLHATRGDLHNSILKLFEGGKLVDTIRVVGGVGAKLEQTDKGVVLSAGYVPGYHPGAITIPLQTT